MDRAVIASVALIALSIAVAFIAPDTDEWRVVRFSAVLIGLGTLIGVLTYRIWFRGAGDNVVAEILENGDE